MPPLVILSKAAAAKLAALPEIERSAALAALEDLPRKFGQPHLHSGLGIRRLRSDVFEFRASRTLRGLFYRETGRIYVDRFGGHDEIRDYLRNRR